MKGRHRETQSTFPRRDNRVGTAVGAASTSWSCQPNGSGGQVSFQTQTGAFSRVIDYPLGSSTQLGTENGSIATLYSPYDVSLKSVAPAAGWTSAVAESSPKIVIRFISGDTSIRVSLHQTRTHNGEVQIPTIIETLTVCMR
jgi:hypothetical protein